jgi:ABC-2 type transport system ATP-binding protein
LLLIDCNNVDAGYGRKVVLQQVSLQFEGGAAGLLGPNGAGKSTLLKTILGFLPPLAGTVKALGHTLPHDAIRVRSRIGYMPEVEAFIPGMNAVQFVAYMGELSGLPRGAAMERSHEVLHYVGLGESRYRNLETYSMGMKQRAKLAQAIVHDPTLLLLDEPTNGMDPQGREEMLELVKDLSRNKGMSVILCSHLLKDVETVADEIIVMGNGRVTSKRLAQRGAVRSQSPVFAVRVRGDRAAFAHRAREAGAKVVDTAGEPGLLIETPAEVLERESGGPTFGTAACATFIYQLAAGAGCVVQRIEQRTEHLEDLFVQAVGELHRADL